MVRSTCGWARERRALLSALLTGMVVLVVERQRVADDVRNTLTSSAAPRATSVFISPNNDAHSAESIVTITIGGGRQQQEPSAPKTEGRSALPLHPPPLPPQPPPPQQVPPPPPPCLTARSNDTRTKRCWRHVSWAMDVGMREHPEWYPGFVAGRNSSADFQRYLRVC